MSGTLEDGTKVAVKVVKRDDQQGGREFLAEVEMLSRLHHRNLVRLLGICTAERNRCLVYELIPNESVESHLYVSDFGLARSALDEENQHISTLVMGTFRYVAPEYAMTGHLLVKSDVYSYGVVILELLTGRKPVDMSMPSGQENLVAWAPEVSHRPFMGEVVQALELVCKECEETRDLAQGLVSKILTPDFHPAGPLRPRRRLQIWEKMKRFSSGNMSDYGDFLKLLSRSR
ncbi:receptor-like serine/threonine-protein kinase ALE2 [Tanacetum coccineum]